MHGEQVNGGDGKGKGAMMSKGKRLTVGEQKAAVGQAWREVARYSIALDAILAGKAPVVSRGKLYTVRLIRPTGPAGGYVAVTFHPEEQVNSTSVDTADNWRSFVTRYTANGPGAESAELVRHAEAVRHAVHVANSPAVSE